MIPEDFQEIITNMSDNAQKALFRAEQFSREFNTGYIGTDHILAGILSVKSSLGAQIAGENGLIFNNFYNLLKENPPIKKELPNFSNPDIRAMSETAVFALRMSWEICKEFNHEQIGTEHIFYAILQQKNSDTRAKLLNMKLDLEKTIEAIEKEFASQNIEMKHNLNFNSRKSDNISRDMIALKKYAEDLTERAKKGEIDKIIGRKKEVQRLITVLLRRNKSNPILIGEAGVGKTAVVELLAQKIIAGDVPPQLIGKKIYEIDLAGMLSGTKFRGEFEQRLKNVIKALENHQEIIAFIDEIHLLAGTGSAEGAMDAANILKPALARGKIKLIGATTFDEFKKTIEKDSALDRRFQSIIVEEPSDNEALEILRGIYNNYEKYHGVKISDEVLKEAVFMSSRYIFERKMPDKAIDILDEASALLASEKTAKPSRINELNTEIESLNNKQLDAVNNEDYERAALYKTRISQLTKKLKEEESLVKSQQILDLTTDYIARAVSLKTGIPVEKLNKNELKILQNLEDHLSKKVIGQKEAVEKVSRAVRRNKSGISDSKKPIGSFIFLGPTGVGKTELARKLASEVFGSSKSLIKIDMSEFSEKHKTSQLLGAPAGYVGYEDGGTLTEKIRRQPYSVVLFDEIEKAHPDTFNLLLQLLEEGELTDSKGRKVSFKNTIIILTSNLGANEMMKESSLGFEVQKQNDDNLELVHKRNEKHTRKALEKMMRPELINRFDGIITFRALTREEIGRIFDLQIELLNNRLIRQGLTIKVRKSAKDLLIEKGYDKKNGARPLKRVIEDLLEYEIAEKILCNEIEKGTQIIATAKNGKIILNY